MAGSCCASLFDCCVAVILRSVDLMKKSSTVLPAKIAQYLLFEACTSKDFVAVEALVRGWSHSELSFDFMLNRYCQRKKELAKSCIEAHNYFNVHSTCEYADCIPSIALGLFNNLHMKLEQNVTPFIRTVNLSKVRVIEESKVQILCKLIRGDFPVTHSTDYVSSSDNKAFSISKPSLLRKVSRKVVLKLNVNIACPELLETLVRSVSSSVQFKVVYSGIQISFVNKHGNFFDSMHLNEIFIDPQLIDLKDSRYPLPGISKNGILWVNTTSTTLSPNLYRVLLSKLQLHPSTRPIRLVVTHLTNNFLIAVMAQCVLVSSFSALPMGQPTPNTIAESRDVLGQFLQATSEKLEHLQLRWYWLSSLPLISLQKCINLRVLSVTVNTNVFSHYTTSDANKKLVQIFDTLQYLHSLEFLEWSEPYNIFSDDLLGLHHLLTTFLPKLQHWHWKLTHLLVSTTDLSKEEMKPLEQLLMPLLAGKTATPSCSTYKFTFDNSHLQHWLETIRPHVCFCYCTTSGSQLQFSNLFVFN